MRLPHLLRLLYFLLLILACCCSCCYFNCKFKSLICGYVYKHQCLLPPSNFSIPFHLQIELLLNEDKLKDEINYLEKKVQLMNDYSEFRKNVALNMADGDLFDNSTYSKTEKLGLLLKWCNLIGQLHGVKV